MTHVGYIGEQSVFSDLTLATRIERCKGGDICARFVDPDGDKIVWWDMNHDSAHMIADNVYTLKARVSAHECYGTVINHVVVLAERALARKP